MSTRRSKAKKAIDDAKLNSNQITQMIQTDMAEDVSGEIKYILRKIINSVILIARITKDCNIKTIVSHSSINSIKYDLIM